MKNEPHNYKVYEVSIEEQVVLTTTFRVAVNPKEELDREATLEHHINQSPGYLYLVDQDGEVVPNYLVEIRDVEDVEPILTNVRELPKEKQ